MPVTTSSARQYRDLLLVLRTQDLGEADRIITGISRDHGLVRAVARGIRKPTAKMGARLEPFMLTDVALARGRSLDTVVQAVTRRAYAAAVVADFELYATGCCVAEVCEHLAQGDLEGSRGLFDLAAGAVSALARGTHQAPEVLASFLARSVSTAGWTVQTRRCVRCGEEQDLHSWTQEDGGTVCDRCRRPGDRHLPEEVRLYLDGVLHGLWTQVGEAPEEGTRARAGRILRDYVQWHAERRFRTFTLLEGS